MRLGPGIDMVVVFCLITLIPLVHSWGVVNTLNSPCQGSITCLSHDYHLGFDDGSYGLAVFCRGSETMSREAGHGSLWL